MQKNMKIENELFLGSLTGVTEDEKIKILEKTKDLENKRFEKKKIAIAPKLVNKKLLRELKTYKISTIELEIQSTNDYILKKCGYDYNMKDIKKAAKMIKWHRFALSFQVRNWSPR